MKVKLLKKVRKQYSIVKYTKIPSDWSDWDKQMLSILTVNTPFYMVLRKGYHLYTGQTYNEVFDVMVSSIVERYKERYRHDNGKKEKVWYNK